MPEIEVRLEEKEIRGLLVDLFIDVHYEYGSSGVELKKVLNNDSDITNELTEKEVDSLLQKCDEHYPNYLKQLDEETIDQKIKERIGA